jgi:DNA-binding SARP family transcriptional activator
MRHRLVLTLLGGFHARFKTGVAVNVPTHQYRALLAFLALPPGRAHPRDKLVALLWDDLPRAQGRTRLRQAILAIRRSLGRAADAALAIEGDTIALRDEAVAVDAVDFQRLARATDGAALERAAALYSGDLLAGLPVREASFEEWLGVERRRLAELAIQTLTRLLAVRRGAGKLEAAVEVAQRLLALDPLQEPAHRALIELYQRLGRRSDALRQYQTCLDVLARELGAEPGPDIRRPYLRVLREGAPAPFATQAEKGQAAAWIATAGSGPLVGRERERSRLRRALGAAVEATGSVVVVTGEAGMGKTRLVADLAGEAARRGARVLLGQCHETDQILAFGPWVEALRQARADRLIELLDDLGATRRGELARLLPELAEGAPPATGEPLPLFEAVAALLERLSADRPVVLVVEDLHWADEMSVRLLAFLARRVTRWKVLVVATARQEELHDAPFVRRALDALAGTPEAAALDLAPLSRDETTMLVRALTSVEASSPAEPLDHQVWSLSEGHPFTVVEMMRSVRRDTASDGTGIGGRLPPRVRETVARRLDRLGGHARRLVEVAAIIGREFDLELLALAADVDGDGVVDGLEELVRRRVVESVGDLFRFVHHRVLEAARPAILPRRAFLHRRVAEAIEERYVDDLEPHLGALVDHYQRAGAWERAVTYLRRTGDLARRRGAYREALVSYETALAAASHLPKVRATQEQEVDLRLGMRYALVPLGQVMRVIQCLEPARQLAETLEARARLAWTELFLSEAWRWLGEYERAVEACRRARALAMDLGDRDLGLFTAVFLASAYVAQGRHAESGPLLEEAVAAVRLDDPRATALLRPAVAPAACGWLARSLALCGEHDRIAALLDETMRHAEAVGSPHAIAVACTLVGETRLLLDDPRGALSVLERGLALCRHAELEHRLAMLEAATGYARALAGRLDEGARLLEAAVARADGQQQYWFQPQRLAWLADVHRRAGRPTVAATIAGRALDLARRIGERDSEALASRVVDRASDPLTSAPPSQAPPTARGPASSGRRRPRRRSA